MEKQNMYRDVAGNSEFEFEIKVEIKMNNL